MKRSGYYSIPLISLLLYCILWYVLSPVLGYMLDSDAVSYLTIARRVAEGDWERSVNGLWSPLNSWVLVPFIQNGYNAWAVAKCVNFVCGVLVLLQVFLLFRRFHLDFTAMLLLQIASSVAVAYFVYFQVFGDVMQLIFALAYLQVLWFKQKNGVSYLQAVVCGVLMGIGYYAKAYSFLFFAFHFFVTLYFLHRNRMMSLKKMMLVYLAGVAAAFICILPWVICLHKKYGVWSLGHAGPLNMSWNINSGKTFKPGITLMIPPVYNDSPSFWEDPYQSHDVMSTPLSSGKHFIKWVARVMHTSLVTLFCFNEISVFGLAVLLSALYFYFFRRGRKDEDRDMQLLLLTVVCLPLGYMVMHIETRYIWLNTFLLMIIAAKLWKDSIGAGPYREVFRNLAIGILAASFILFPLLQFKELRFKNKELFETAGAMNARGFRSAFTSSGKDAGRMWVIAYLTGNPFYTIERSEFSDTELHDEMKRYNVSYYLAEPGTAAPGKFLQATAMFNGFTLYELKK